MPTVARWWENRTAPQRIELYTRWSFYIWLAMAPLLALGIAGSAAQRVQPATTVFVLASVAVAATAVLLARAGLAAHGEGRGLPRRPALAAAAAAVAAAAAAVLAFTPDAPDTPALPWGVAMPPAMALVAASTVWPTRTLTRAGSGIGGATGIVVLAIGAPLGVGAVLAIVVGATSTFLTLAFRFSVWVLDVVREMERSRGAQLQLAVAEERLRFARDLHDVMGRNLSAIAVKSQLAAELVRRGRDGAAEELADISRVAEESLREVRDVVRGYRRTDLAGELAGARSVLRAAGVGCTVSGEDGGAALPEPVQAALGWVVREAVTNVLRHSRATECTVELRTAGGEAELTVTNDGVAGSGSGWGSGLTGLAERLAVAGGRLSTRRERDRFVLTASLPVGVPA
ncbi:sensor histidine kinase [Geodermatophilus sabuli]|uniref:sensor histidine kinase n=1 Tax=Geodermatophilus sabuli TaxID=1564158 RepID=UPI001558432A|nr:histidine kinase [Geodermatophilus sabuli]MBB3085205.1 two-component system sensor histidine kinase DesK [Geodermatophilus sabuli]